LLLIGLIAFNIAVELVAMGPVTFYALEVKSFFLYQVLTDQSPPKTVFMGAMRSFSQEYWLLPESA